MEVFVFGKWLERRGVQQAFICSHVMRVRPHALVHGCCNVCPIGECC